MTAEKTAPKKKARGTRTRLTHFEVRRAGVLRLRLAIADDAMDEVGDELGALMRRIAPCTRQVPAPAPQDQGQVQTSEFLFTPEPHDDENYHANLRQHLTDLFGSLCDVALADALEIAREERARRAEGSN